MQWNDNFNLYSAPTLNYPPSSPSPIKPSESPPHVPAALISELNCANPFFLYNCTWPSFSAPIEAQPTPSNHHHHQCPSARRTSVIVVGHEATPVRWCQVHCNYCGHCCYDGAATSKNTQTLVLAKRWPPPSHLSWCVLSRNSAWLAPWIIQCNFSLLLIQEKLEEQLMRADEYLMALSLLDKSGLRDDKRRGIKQAWREKKDSRKGGRRGEGHRAEGVGTARGLANTELLRAQRNTGMPHSYLTAWVCGSSTGVQYRPSPLGHIY